MMGMNSDVMGEWEWGGMEMEMETSWAVPAYPRHSHQVPRVALLRGKSRELLGKLGKTAAPPVPLTGP